jgi:hypothetical protein
LVDGGVKWSISDADLETKTITGDCPGDYLPSLVEKDVPCGVWIPCAKSRQVDESRFYPNMYLAGAPAIIGLAAEAKVFNS